MTTEMEKLNEKRAKALAKAELFDAWRLVPRFLVGIYGAMVAYLVVWFLAIETYTKTQCQEELLLKLLDRDFPIEQAQSIACTVVDIVGGPTTPHTIFVTTICGLATGIFAFYTSTGRSWSKSMLPWKWGENTLTKEQIDNEQKKADLKDQIDDL